MKKREVWRRKRRRRMMAIPLPPQPRLLGAAAAAAAGAKSVAHQGAYPVSGVSPAPPHEPLQGNIGCAVVTRWLTSGWMRRGETTPMPIWRTSSSREVKIEE